MPVTVRNRGPAAAAIRARDSTKRRRAAAGDALAPLDATGTTPPGTASSPVRMREDAATKPRASASAAAHSAQLAMCASTASRSERGSSPSSHAWIIPSSRCCIAFPPLLLLLQPLVLFHEPAPCPGECRSHGSDRQPERRRDLRIIQPFLSHQQRKAIALGEPIHRGARHRRLLPTLYRRLFRLDRAALPFLLNHRGRLAPAP